MAIVKDQPDDMSLDWELEMKGDHRVDHLLLLLRTQNVQRPKIDEICHITHLFIIFRHFPVGTTQVPVADVMFLKIWPLQGQIQLLAFLCVCRRHRHSNDPRKHVAAISPLLSLPRTDDALLKKAVRDASSPIYATIYAVKPYGNDSAQGHENKRSHRYCITTNQFRNGASGRSTGRSRPAWAWGQCTCRGRERERREREGEKRVSDCGDTESSRDDSQGADARHN